MVEEYLIYLEKKRKLPGSKDFIKVNMVGNFLMNTLKMKENIRLIKIYIIGMFQNYLCMVQVTLM